MYVPEGAPAVVPPGSIVKGTEPPAQIVVGAEVLRSAM